MCLFCKKNQNNNIPISAKYLRCWILVSFYSETVLELSCGSQKQLALDRHYVTVYPSSSQKCRHVSRGIVQFPVCSDFILWFFNLEINSRVVCSSISTRWMKWSTGWTPLCPVSTWPSIDPNSAGTTPMSRSFRRKWK